MAAYAILDVEIFDIEKYLAFQKAIRPLLAAVGARYLARGGEFRIYDGDYQPQRLILLEFPTLEVMDDFFASPAFLALDLPRHACCNARILGVEGL